VRRRIWKAIEGFGRRRTTQKRRRLTMDAPVKKLERREKTEATLLIWQKMKAHISSEQPEKTVA
jgi:hypothetical protein